jgi:hypothetical protein
MEIDQRVITRTIANFKVSSTYLEFRGDWVGVCIEHGVKGTHENYNVRYNGACRKETFKSSDDALNKAISFITVDN